MTKPVERTAPAAGSTDMLLLRLQQAEHERALRAHPMFSSAHWQHNAGPDWPEQPDDDSYIAFENCKHPDCVTARQAALSSPPVVEAPQHADLDSRAAVQSSDAGSGTQPTLADGLVHQIGAPDARARQQASTEYSARQSMLDDGTVQVFEMISTGPRRSVGEWQPISTAPKDGTRVLLYWPYWDQWPVVGMFDRFQRWVTEMAVSTEGPGPTHWMPLPAPPAAALPASREDE